MNQLSDIKRMEMPTPWIIGSVNVFLILGDTITLVDCGMKDEHSWGLFLIFLEKQGLCLKDIDQIVLTHHHSDHIGFLDYLLDVHPIPVYGHKNCRPYLMNDVEHMKNGTRFFQKMYTEFGLSISQAEALSKSDDWADVLTRQVELAAYLEENNSIPGLPEWEVIETKGHAQSHISLYRRCDQVLICGDHLIKHAPAGIFMEPPIYPETERSRPLLQYIDSIKKCLTIPVSMALSGHGDAIENVPDLLNETLLKIDKRAERLKNQITAHKMTGFEIIQKLYPDKYNSDLALFISDTIGLLDLLLERTEITVEERDGVIYYDRN